MRKTTLLFCMILYSYALFAQSNDLWRDCIFPTFLALDTFDIDTEDFFCNRAFIQATNEHYYWNGDSWLQSEAYNNNIYTGDGVLDTNRTVTLGAYNLELDMDSIGDFNILDDGIQAFTVKDDGMVGIGNITPVAPLHILEITGTPASATDGTIVLEHRNIGGESSIVFKSYSDIGSDYGYISYSDDGSGNGFNTQNSLLTIGVENEASTSNKVDDIAIMPSGALGVGTISPKARLDVAGGSVRFSDYGTGNYIDEATVGNPATATYTLAVDSDGDIVEVNIAKSSRIFYPPPMIIDVSSLGTNLTVDMHDRYETLYSAPAVISSGAPATVPTYAETEFYYYLLSYDSAVFSNLSISAAGVLTYDIYSVPTYRYATLNVIFVIK